MSTFFANMGGMLKTGWNTLSNIYIPGVTPTQINFTSPFFTTPQKEKITPSVVTPRNVVAPSPRQVAQDAPTVTPWYKNWWNNSVNFIKSATSGFTKSIQGKPIDELKRKSMNTLASSVSTIFETGIGSLTGYFQNKWGMTPRGQSGNEGNTPVVPNQPVVYLNTTQSPAPATTSGIQDFFRFLGSGLSQPVGTYSIANPQQAPIPSGMQTGVGTLAANYMPAVILIGIVAILFFAFRKGGAR